MRVDVQIATDLETPAEQTLVAWATLALATATNTDYEMTLRVVGLDEGCRLNEQWRKGAGATNVLAFPIEGLDVQTQLLGDVVICASVANIEAQRDGKDNDAHWAHLAIHGTLHLLGYDHQDDADASKMEALECTLLGQLGYRNPYL